MNTIELSVNCSSSPCILWIKEWSCPQCCWVCDSLARFSNFSNPWNSISKKKILVTMPSTALRVISDLIRRYDNQRWFVRSSGSTGVFSGVNDNNPYFPEVQHKVRSVWLIYWTAFTQAENKCTEIQCVQPSAHSHLLPSLNPHLDCFTHPYRAC